MVGPRFIDVCAGAGGLALGLEQAGFEPVLLLDNKRVACDTLRSNRPTWEVVEDDLRVYVPSSNLRDVDLLSAGLPRVKSNAGGAGPNCDGELSLVKAAVSLMHEIQPKALLLENMPNLATAQEYENIRTFVREELEHLGYQFMWFVLNAADYGVPQDRKQGILVALAEPYFEAFRPPVPTVREHRSVGAALAPSMASRGWSRAEQWAAQANRVAPTLVGGSERRGGADLGPTGSRRAWAGIGVDGSVLADKVPGPDFVWDPGQGRSGMVRITVDQAALLQGFPPEWKFAGRKTARYRQIGHASPPPVGKALGLAIQAVLNEPKSVVAG
ncbi:DNA (cytosine-5-)-methyltransferase [Nocardia flavorosea]|uniref:DNA cytosine methyltransferase n=1 Tax=Nocardia flavorosea TaxID=53429 RepID=UPI001893F051|nr:DNA (cytosine-5-)-methyltransferase [Nocardia flavorosea]MBF6349004.1 DNA (cytosine-5-)-methyltransferase [Nocardia flavorosea]